jgi:hypothetical protein
VKTIRQSIEKDSVKSKLRVTVPWGNDEIQYLSVEMNHLLLQIQENNSKMESMVNRLGSEEGAVRMMVNSLPDSVVIIDPATGVLTSVNTTFEKAFFSLASMKDKTIYDIIPSMQDNTLFKVGRLPKTDALALGVFGTKIPAVIHCVALPVSYEEKDGKSVEIARHMVVIHDAREKEENDAKVKQQQRAQEKMKKQIIFEEQFNEPIIREAFIRFCTKERTLENVSLLIELESYKKLDQSSRMKKQKVIHERFLKDGAKEGVNISNESKIEAIAKCQNGVGQIDLFNLLEKAIKFNLMNESFSRFQAVKMEIIDDILKEMEEKGGKVRVSGSTTTMKVLPSGFLQPLDDRKGSQGSNLTMERGTSSNSLTPMTLTPVGDRKGSSTSVSPLGLSPLATTILGNSPEADSTLDKK